MLLGPEMRSTGVLPSTHSELHSCSILVVGLPTIGAKIIHVAASLHHVDVQ